MYLTQAERILHICPVSKYDGLFTAFRCRDTVDWALKYGLDKTLYDWHANLENWVKWTSGMVHEVHGDEDPPAKWNQVGGFVTEGTLSRQRLIEVLVNIQMIHFDPKLTQPEE